MPRDRVLQDSELTKITAIKGILRLVVEEVKSVDPSIAFGADFVVISIELARPTPSSEEIWNFDFLGRHCVFGNNL